MRTLLLVLQCISVEYAVNLFFFNIEKLLLGINREFLIFLYFYSTAAYEVSLQ